LQHPAKKPGALFSELPCQP